MRAVDHRLLCLLWFLTLNGRIDRYAKWYAGTQKRYAKKQRAYQAKSRRLWQWPNVRTEAKRHNATYETLKTRIAYHRPKRSGSSWRLSFHSTKVSTGNQSGNLKKTSKGKALRKVSTSTKSKPPQDTKRNSRSGNPDHNGRTSKTVGKRGHSHHPG